MGESPLSSLRATLESHRRFHVLAIVLVLGASLASAVYVEGPGVADERPRSEVLSNQRARVVRVSGPADLVIDPDDLTPVTARGGFELGVTHLRELTATGASALADVSAENNQFIMGFGVPNPEPAPGRYDFHGLDRAVERLRRAGAPISITLCCSPDWMKGGASGETDYSRIDVAPLPEHFADFAALAARVAARYPDVKKFQVWSELRGFYRSDLNRWDHEAYTSLYNQVYDAIKEVRPDALVGGPYVVMDSWSTGGSHPSAIKGPWGTLDQRPLDLIDHWLANAHGADFISIDGRLGTKDEGWITEPLDSIGKVDAVLGWLRTRSQLPVQWAELYVVPHDSPLDMDARAAVLATTAIHLATAGATDALLWGADASKPAVDTPVLTEDGQPTVIARTAQLVAALASPSEVRSYLDDRRRGVAVYANDDVVLIVDLSGAARSVAVGSTIVELRPWEVLSIRR